jgi:hypothetical protein
LSNEDAVPEALSSVPEVLSIHLLPKVSALAGGSQAAIFFRRYRQRVVHLGSIDRLIAMGQLATALSGSA